MRLLRITQHLKEQNWLAVFLDFLIVVIGVFIGLQVSNWNQDRQSQLRESLLLNELVEDLEADLQELELVLYFTKIRYSADVTLLQRAIKWQIPDQYPRGFEEYGDYAKPDFAEAMVASDALYFSVRISDFDIELRTYTKILSNGDFTFTHHPELPERLRKHYNAALQWVESEVDLHNPLYQKLINAYMKNGIGQLDTISWQELENLIAREPELQGLLKNSIWYSAIQHVFLNDIKKSTIEIIESIKSPDR